MSKEKVKASVTDLIDSNIKPLEASMTALVKTNEPGLINPNLQELKRKTETLVSISPNRCRPWKFADRSELEMGDIEALALSISRHGQQEPALLRPLKKPEDGIEYEVIFGNRRWRACLKLNKPLKAIATNISDQEAAVAQKEENENREDISDFSKAMYYKKLLKTNVFKSQEQLSSKMGIGHSTLVDLLSYTRIHPDVLKAFTEPHKLGRTHAVKLAALSSKADNKGLQALIKIVPKIQEGKIPSRKIEEEYKKLTNPKQDQTSSKSSEHMVVNQDGKVIFTKKVNSKNEWQISFPSNITTDVNMKNLEEHIKRFFSRQNP